MTKKFAVFFLLPFEKEPLCIFEEGTIVRNEKGHSLDPDQEIVCININDYLHTLISPKDVPKRIFDVNAAVRMLTGFASSKFTESNAPWKGFACLGKHLAACRN
jgi:hypothetical protein